MLEMVSSNPPMLDSEQLSALKELKWRGVEVAELCAVKLPKGICSGPGQGSGVTFNTQAYSHAGVGSHVYTHVQPLCPILHDCNRCSLDYIQVTLVWYTLVLFPDQGPWRKSTVTERGELYHFLIQHYYIHSTYHCWYQRQVFSCTHLHLSFAQQYVV